jgi:hypothetical protein
MTLPRKGLKMKGRAKEVNVDKVDAQVTRIRELPEMQDHRLKNIVRRNEALRANQYYNNRLEQERILAALSRSSTTAERDAIQMYLGRLQNKMHKIAKMGFLPMDLQPS